MGNLLYPSLFLCSLEALGYARSHHSPAGFQLDPASSAQPPLFLSSPVVSAVPLLSLFFAALPILL